MWGSFQWNITRWKKQEKEETRLARPDQSSLADPCSAHLQPAFPSKLSSPPPAAAEANIHPAWTTSHFWPSRSYLLSYGPVLVMATMQSNGNTVEWLNCILAIQCDCHSAKWPLRNIPILKKSQNIQRTIWIALYWNDNTPMWLCKWWPHCRKTIVGSEVQQPLPKKAVCHKEAWL